MLRAIIQIFGRMKENVTAAEKSKLNGVEKIVWIIVFVLMIIGIVAALTNKIWFEQKYVVEDGFIEDLTLIPLAIITLACVIYLIKFTRKKTVLFFLIYFFIGLGSFFVLGEEISWGQRIFNFQTSEYFKEHNSQDEENIHNLILDGEKLNKIIFTDGVIACAVIYLVGFPILYKRKNNFKAFIDRNAIPIATIYQVISCMLVFGLSFLTFDSKGAELLEFGGSSMFMLIVLYPFNKAARS